MTEETRYLAVRAYRDSQGNPCCAASFEDGRVCRFYRTRNFGVSEECSAVVDELSRCHRLERRGDGTGTLIPAPGCPVWEEAKEKP